MNTLIEKLERAKFYEVKSDRALKSMVEKDSKETYRLGVIEDNACYSLPPGCDCVCNQPCHGEGPCYSL